jgi:hypothetical protein
MPDRLGDARRSSGARIEQQRRGADNTAARRASGRAMESNRTGAAVQEDINRLVRPTAPRQQLKTVPPVGALPPQRGRADYKAPATGAAGGSGIASPLIEQDYTARTYWSDVTVTSTDGLRSFVIKPIKEITQLDASLETVKQQFAQPPAVAP